MPHVLITTKIQDPITNQPFSDPASLRDLIFKRDGYRCVYCGRVLPAEALSMDHVQPRMRGGDNSPGNLVTACREDNARKASLAAWAWLAELPVERANFLRYAEHVWPRLRRAVMDAASRKGA